MRARSASPRTSTPGRLGSPPASIARGPVPAKTFESGPAGRASAASNLASALYAARGDSLYARVAFRFLGLLGALLAGLLTAAISGTGADRRRRYHALLRAR